MLEFDTFTMLRFAHLVAFLVLAVSALAAEMRVATLNCRLLFSPEIDHRGKVDEQDPLSINEYRDKVANLATLIRKSGAEVIGLQETGGRLEIEDLAKELGYQWAFAKGKDTYTGQEVGLLHKLPAGWRVSVNGRVGALDKLLSKHLLVTASNGREEVRFLVVHLLRPIGANVGKHELQLGGLNEWLLSQKGAAVVLGDFNNTKSAPLLHAGHDAAELNRFAATHRSKKCLDRLVARGAVWRGIEVFSPPGGARNDTLARLWTDHFLVTATLATD